MIASPQAQPDLYAYVLIKRLLAWGIDVAVTLLLCLLIIPFTAFVGVFVFPLMFIVVGFFYRYFSISRLSATPGMYALSVELRDSDGMVLSRETALHHTLGYTFSIMIPVVQLVSVAMMITNEDGKGLTDSILGTVAINRIRRFN